MHSQWHYLDPGSAILNPIHLLELLLQKYSRTGIELFPSWVHQPLHPNPEVNPLGDNWDKLRLFVLGFQWLKRVSLGNLKLKLLPSF